MSSSLINFVTKYYKLLVVLCLNTKLQVILVFFFSLRASTSVDVKLCKIQKVTNFTHFASKIFHISHSKILYI